MYDGNIISFRQYLKHGNVSTESIRARVSQHTWRRERVFKLLNHGTNGSLCMVGIGHYAGKLCVFPFFHPDCNVYPKIPECKADGSVKPVTHTKCVKNSLGLLDSYGSCSVKTYWNDSHITGEFSAVFWRWPLPQLQPGTQVICCG